MKNQKLSAKALLNNELLSGFPAASIDVDKPTIFTLTIPLNRPHYGCIVWIKAQMEIWLQQIAEISGVIPIKSSVIKNKKTLQYLFLVTFSIPWSIKREFFNNVTGQMICSQFQRLLAKEVCKRFPLPFSLKNPLYAKDFPDTYILMSCTNDPRANKRAEEKLFSAETFSAFEIWAKKCGASLICLKKTNRANGNPCIVFVVKWRVDRNEKSRRVFCSWIEKILVSFGIDHAYANNMPGSLSGMNFYYISEDRDLFFLSRHVYDKIHPRHDR